MRVMLYSIHCPCCEVLRKKQDDAGIAYDLETDTRKMLGLGITHLPMLRVDDDLMNYPAALAWLKERTNAHEN